MDEPLSVLFVDDHNATRSRMAEAILRAQGEGDFEVTSVGAQPRALDPTTRELIRRFDMDPGSESGRSLDDVAGQRYDFVIVLRDERGGEAAFSVPSFGAATVAVWDIPDPAAEPAVDDEAREQSYRRAFELLRQRVQVFMLAQHEQLRERGSDHVIGAHQPDDAPVEPDGQTRLDG